MTDGVASRSFFCLKTAKKLPKIERNCPNTIRQLLPNPPKNKSSKSGTRDCPLDSMELRGVEKAKIACAKKLFNYAPTSDVRFGAISNYDELLNIIQGA